MMRQTRETVCHATSHRVRFLPAVSINDMDKNNSVICLAGMAAATVGTRETKMTLDGSSTTSEMKFVRLTSFSSQHLTGGMYLRVAD